MGCVLGLTCDIGRFFGKVLNCAVPGLWDVLGLLGTCLGGMIESLIPNNFWEQVGMRLGYDWEGS